MAETFVGFSIREYTLKMRSKDVLKCWPFSSKDSERLSKEEVAAMLPPMEVIKFRYWRDELEDVKNKNQLNKDMCESSNGLELDEHEVGLLKNLDDKSDDNCKSVTATTRNALNAHFDSCNIMGDQTSRKKSMKGKARATKKRSIVDIFAESLLIEKVGADKRVGQAKEAAASSVKRSLRNLKMTKGIKIQESSQTDGIASKKVDQAKEYAASSVKKSLRNVKITKGIKIQESSQKDGVATNKKNGKDLNSCLLSNSTKRASASSCRKRSALETTDADPMERKTRTLESKKRQCGKPTQLIDKKWTRKPSGCGILENYRIVTEQCSSTVCNRSDSSKDGPPSSQKFEKHLGFSDVRCAIGDKEQTAHGLAEIVSVGSINDNNASSTKAGSSSARFPTFAGKLDYSEDQPLHIAASCSLAGGKSCFQPSLSLFPPSDNQNGRLSHLSQVPTENIGGHHIGKQPCFSRPSMQFIGNISNYPEWKKRKLMLEEEYNHGNYFGLPLNSQGEYIQLGSGSFSENYHAEMPNMVTGSSSALHFHSYLPSQTGNYVIEESKGDQLNLFPLHSNAMENSEVEFPLRSNLVNSGTARREDVICPNLERRSTMSSLLGSDLSSSNTYYHGLNGRYDQIPYQRGKEMVQLQNYDRNTFNNTQPTVRLMGKDVAIGQNNEEMTYLQKGESLADKNFVLGYHPTVSSRNDYFEKSVLYQNCSSHAGAGNLGEHASQPTYPYINWQTSSGLRRGILTISDDPSSGQCIYTDPPSTLAMLNRTKNSREQIGPEIDFFKASSKSFAESSTFQDMHSRSEFKQISRPFFEFPFLHPDYGLNFEEFWPQNFKSIPQSTQQSQSFKYFPQSYSDIVGNFHSPSTFVLRNSRGPEIRHQAGASGPQNSMTSRMPMSVLPSHEPASHHPFVPVCPSGNATFPHGSCNKTVRTKDMTLKDVMTDPYQWSRTRKMPADGDGNLTRPSF